MLENHMQLDAVVNAKLKNPVNIWIKLDTGMHRLGFQPDEAELVFQKLKQSQNVAQSMVLAAHFSCADDLDNNHTDQQFERFDAAFRQLDSTSIKTSLSNSAAILDWSNIHDNWQRPGYMLHGNTLFTRTKKRRSIKTGDAFSVCCYLYSYNSQRGICGLYR